MLEERTLKKIVNLERIFVIVDYEAFKGKCDFRFKTTETDGCEYCGTFGRDALKKCREDNCPYVYAIVTEAKEEIKRRPIYMV